MSSCQRPARARSRCRCAQARRSWLPASTTPRRAAASRPSARLSSRSAAGGRPRCVGKAPAEAWGRKFDLDPAVSTQERLQAELPRPAGRVLFAGAEDARRVLVDELGADFIALYRPRTVRPAQPPEGDFVVLASASAARGYAELGLSIPVVSIGPETTAAARAAARNVLQEARTHDLEGLVEAVLAASA